MNDLRHLNTITDLVNQKNWAAIEGYFNQSQQLKHFGISIDLSDINQPKCAIKTIEPYHLGGIGQDYVNGAIISAMIDLSIGLTGLNVLKEGHLATSQITINFKKPLSNKPFYALSSVVEVIDNQVFAQSMVYNQDGEICATGIGIVRINLKNTQ
jgi:acyl-coenzyme A thioesterase PaaI-like protein